MSLIDLYINDGGRIRRIGDNCHDMLTITEDGKLHYCNLQNGDGCRLGEESEWYNFVPNEDDYGYNCDPRAEQTEPSDDWICTTCKHHKDSTEERAVECRECGDGGHYERKEQTENCSEFPNNCEDCKHWNDSEDGCANRHGCKTEPSDGERKE